MTQRIGPVHARPTQDEGLPLTVSQARNLFLVWRIYQRRSESVAASFGLTTCYYHYSWEEKSKFHKLISYGLKATRSISDLLRHRPVVVFVQLPPTPLLYIVTLYSLATGARVVADCHNAMVCSSWGKWPFTRDCLAHAAAVLVHNVDVYDLAKLSAINCVVMRDPLPQIRIGVPKSRVRAKLDLAKRRYIIIPWSFAPDEPVAEMFEAARSCPDVAFVMTWFPERLPAQLKSATPPNLNMTGFLPVEDFNDLFAHAAASLVLTTREGTQPSAASESMVLNVPLIVSDMETAHKLYGDAPVYVANTAEGIASGVRTAIAQRPELQQRMRVFLQQYKAELDREIDLVKRRLAF